MIYFVGAGPGDIDLITVKGRRLLSTADVVIYTGALVWDSHLRLCKEGCKTYSSESMTLEEIIHVMLQYDDPRKTVVRLHTGDPTIYGTIGEQIRILQEKEIEFEVVPGVSSFNAACAALNREFTLPGVSHTVIITLVEGDPNNSELEELRELASHKCSLAIFSSIQGIDRVVETLKQGYDREDVPIAIIYKASWPEQIIIRGTLSDIARKVKDAEIYSFSQILVGDFIEN